MNLVQTIIISIVEGLTEFIPVSSTGHMIIAEKILQVPDDEFTKMFTVAIQFGAILAVVTLYRDKFLKISNVAFFKKLAIGVIPAIVLGFLLSKHIDALLESSITVAVSLLLGGIILVFIDKAFTNPQIHSEQDITNKNALLIGFWQCLAMIPGVSRSASSIIGGMQQKLSRSAAAEFSFFLAVPTMLAATGYKLLKYAGTNGGFSSNDIKLLLIGNLVAFIVAMFAIKFFIGFLKKYGFKVWGIYRIVIGMILLLLIATGYIKS